MYCSYIFTIYKIYKDTCPRYLVSSALDLLLKTEALPAEALPASMPLLAEGPQGNTGDGDFTSQNGEVTIETGNLW